MNRPGRLLVAWWAACIVGALVLAACNAPTAAQPHRATAAVTAHAPRRIHSPGVVTDDVHLQPGQCHIRDAADGDPLPDPDCTPGAYDPAVTQATIATTICKAGWTATVRPPESDTNHWKAISRADYGDPATFVGEYDHLIPLELGGANSTSNLWPEPGAIPNAKDLGPENHLKAAVCAGTLTLAKARREIATNWTTATW